MEKTSSKKNSFSTIIILLLIIALGYLGYVVSKLNKQNHEISKELSGIVEENKEMNRILINENILSGSESNDLKSNLKLMLTSYDSLEASNTMAVDSIDQQREKIKSLLGKINNLNNKSKKDWRKIFKLQKEAETLRGIMKGYIHTIDSLNTLNINLSNSLTEKTRTLNKVNYQNKEFKEQNKELKEKVLMGAVLQAGNITVNAIRIRNSGTQSETTRASRTEMIKVCYTLVENKLAKSGDKTIYLRVLTKSGELLSSEIPMKSTNFKKEAVEMSSKRTINYQNQNTDMCIFHELIKEITPGNYTVEIYNEGYLIGESSFSLR
jgi:hypothetical protein